MAKKTDGKDGKLEIVEIDIDDKRLIKIKYFNNELELFKNKLFEITSLNYYQKQGQMPTIVEIILKEVLLSEMLE